MPDFHPHHTVPYPFPRDITIPQFILDSDTHPLRPSRLPGSKWLVDDVSGRAFGIEEIRERVERLARAIKERWGVGKGDVACLYSANDVDYPMVIWALHRLGAIVSCANPSYTHSELEYQLEATSSKLLFTSSASLSTALKAASSANLFPPSNIIVFSPVSPARTPAGEFATVQSLVDRGWDLVQNYTELRGPDVGDNIAFLSFSSGTTGLPKAIAIAHRNLIANVLQVAMHERLTERGLRGDDRFALPGDACMGVLPMYHIYGLVMNLHFVLFCGMTLVVCPKFNFKNMLESIVRHHITHLYIVPPQVVMLNPITKQYDLSHVRFAMVGAAPLSKEVTEKFKGMFPRMRMGQGYGMTETCTIVSKVRCRPPPYTESVQSRSFQLQFLFQQESVNGSAGVLIPDTIARIVKEDGSIANYNEPGELWVRGPQMALCYANNKKATEETFLPEGWVRTGDEALMTKEGNLFVVDRLKEILKVNGFQVAPAELEGHLIVHPYVQDAGVVGIADEYKGEMPLGFVVLEHSVSKRAQDPKEAETIRQELRKWVADNKVRYKHLDGGVEFVQAVPKNPSGKILRRLLRDQAEEVVRKRGEAGKTRAKL
ncbi:phenylacetyl-CoA ligase [Dacryopinax primogenitus]|uniref:Phenylacetyl-CoA ligase n=1 Tax=Dacryopinax primogenitus (strain DJM 731) TaxID=1858805 RepID=M5FR90_DACPD|nr:phenylacetyl-CoA ligase [Dacryopinax primogenitus]EJT97429.1 phenylacetyl-CoA ligase [Dacryopinax primogenitus]